MMQRVESVNPSTRVRDSAWPRPTRRDLLVILLVALALRLAMSAARPLTEVSDDGGFYLSLARRTVVEGYPFLSVGNPDGQGRFAGYHTSVGPLYPAFLIVFLSALPQDAALVGVRIAQSLLDILSIWLVYRIGSRMFGRRAGLVAMIAMALDVRFLLQAPDPTTETLYIALTLAGFYLYVSAVDSDDLRRFVWSGVVFGLATLTRPVPILLPIGLSLHALLAGRDRKHLLRGIALMALSLWAVVIPWIIRNALVTSGEFIPVSDVGASTFWLGSTDDGRYHGHEDFNEARTEEFETPDYERESAQYVEAGVQNILAKPLTYVRNRIRNTVEAYLQPYGTVWFEGESIKQVARDWLSGTTSLADVLGTEAFWPKLVVYIFHFSSVGLGLAGLVLARRKWRDLLPLALVLAYGTAVYSVLLVIPRYLFPLMPYYWIAAGWTGVWLWTRVTAAKNVEQSRH